MAAEFHGDALHMRARQRRELLSDSRRSGEGDFADDRMRNEIGGNLGRHAIDEIDRAVRHASIDDRLDQRRGEAGVSSGALMMMEQPAASAAPSFRAIWMIGKFQGVKAATGPTGCLMTRFSTFSARAGTTRP